MLTFIAGNDALNRELVSTWLIVMVAVSAACFIISELTANYSQVDKVWSILPGVYSIITLTYSATPRLIIMSVLVFTWGFRLSYNFYRKGGYNIIPWKGEEDYRWKVLRNYPALKGRLRFGLFNLFFISFYQNLLIMLFSSPLLVAAAGKGRNLNIADALSAVLMLGFIILEALSDNQLFSFYQMKKKAVPVNGKFSGSLAGGFMKDGMWQYVRHPNFASEQMIWISFYFFSVAATGNILVWTVIGPVLLGLLFFGSSEFTEKISSRKYPGYEEYKKAVPRFVPRLFKGSSGN